MSLLARFAAIAALILAAGAPAVAQDVNAPATFANLNLSTGFTPDPIYVELVAGGTIDVSQRIDGCAGFVANAPDVQLTFQSGALPLAISVASSADTTLVVNTPDGQWFCDDDSGGGLNPSLVFQPAGSGTYDIWVGTYGSSSATARVAISELSSY